MARIYILKPTSIDGYTPEACRLMEEHIQSLPAVYRRPNGCFVLCDSEGMRDVIVSNGWDRLPRDGYEHVWIKPDEVECTVDHDNRQIWLIAEFMRWVIARWPSELSTEFGRPL